MAKQYLIFSIVVVVVFALHLLWPDRLYAYGFLAAILFPYVKAYLTGFLFPRKNLW